jgi:hypothetical protein
LPKNAAATADCAAQSGKVVKKFQLFDKPDRQGTKRVRKYVDTCMYVFRSFSAHVKR